MNAKKFNEIMEERINKTRSVLGSKAKEYGIGNTDGITQEPDRLYNFKRQAEIKRETALKALYGNYTKHLVSVIDLFEGRTLPTRHLIDEKIGDSINYLILAEALMIEDLEDEGANTLL